MIQNITKIMAFVMALLLLQGCARDLSSDVYTSSSTFNLALEGTVLSARKVTVKDSDRLQGNDIGALAGGVTGGVAANQLSNNNGLATVVGGVGGAVAGAYVQDALSTSAGFEYIVKVDSSKISNDLLYDAPAYVQKALASATTSGLVTIVQGAKGGMIQVGSPVYVIYGDARARIVPAR